MKKKFNQTSIKIQPLVYLISILIFLNPFFLTQKYHLFFSYKLLVIQIIIFLIAIIFFISYHFEVKKNNKILYIVSLLYLLYNVFRTVISKHYFYGKYYLIYLIPVIILFLILSKIGLNKKERKLIAYSLVFSFILSIIPGYFLQSQHSNFSRLSLNWTNSNYYASYLLIIISFHVYLWKVFSEKVVKNNLKKYIFLLLFILTIILLLWTQSRGGLLTFLIIGTFLIIVYSIRKSKFKLLSISLLILLILFCGMYYTFKTIRPNTIIFRERIYGATINYIKDFCLFGSGIGTYAHYFPKYRLSDYKLLGQEDIITHTHNEFLEQWAETGLIGLLLFVVFIVLIIKCGIKKINKFHAEKKIFILASLISFLFFIVHNLFSITMRICPLQIYFFIFAGLISSDYEEFQVPLNHQKKWKYILLIIIPLFIWLISINIKNIRGLSYFQKSKDELLYSKPKLSTSIKYAEKALKFIPHNPQLLYHLGYSNNYYKDYNKANKYFERLLKISPYYPQAHFWKGYIYSVKGDWANAIKEYKKEIEFNEYTIVYFNMANAYHNYNNEESAMKYFRIYLDKIVEKIYKNVVSDKNSIIYNEKYSIDFALERLEKYYIDKDKNKISELENIKKILLR